MNSKNKTYKLSVMLDPINLAGLPVYTKITTRIADYYRRKHKKIREHVIFRLTFDHAPTVKELWSKIDARSVEITGVRPYQRFHGDCMTAEVIYRQNSLIETLLHLKHKSDMALAGLV